MSTSPAPRTRRRRKIPLACEPCRERKSRCDGVKPICTGCQRRSLKLEDCVYTLDNARTASNEAYIKTLHERIRQLEDACTNNGFELPPIPSDQEEQDSKPVVVKTRASSSASPVLLADAALDPARAQPGPQQHSLFDATTHSQGSISPPPFGQAQHQQLERSRSGGAFGSPSPRSSLSGGHVSAALETGYATGGSSWRLPTHTRPSYGQQGGAAGVDLDTGVTAMGTLSAEDGVLHGSPDTLGPTCGAADDFYYGTSSAASFIRQACCSIRRNPLSTSPVPPRQQQQQHLQQPHQHQRHVQQPVLGLATAFVLPPRQLADHLIDVYFRRVFYLYPFFHRPAFEASYRALFEGGGPSSTSSPTTGATNDSSINDSGGRFAGVGLGGSPAEGAHSAVFHCALNAVFAIATYHSNLPADEKPRAAEAFFLRAKEHIGIHLLEHNNLAAVQALLVTALFLQSTPYPGRCWNSVGIACRLAQGLGLHAELGAGRSQLQTEMRRRTWYGCVVLDMLVSMTFGRPTMTTFSNIPLPSIVDDPLDNNTLRYPNQLTPTRSQFFVEMIRMSKILEQIISRVYQPWRTGGHVGGEHSPPFSLETVNELDAQLSQFEKAVPWPLNWATGAGVEMSGLSPDMGPLLRMQKNVLRARSLYLRLMLFRPVLSQLVADRDRLPTYPDPAAPDVVSPSFAAQCGQSCTQAAVDLIDMTLKTYRTQETGAWWWNGLYASTAGMVLILAQSSPRVASYVDRAQVLSAWDKCQDILSTLSVMSVSIQKSLRLLQTLNDAVQQSASSHEQQQVGGTAPERDGVAGASQAAFLMNPYAMIDVPDMVDMDVVEAALVSWDQEMEFGFDFSALG